MITSAFRIRQAFISIAVSLSVIVCTLVLAMSSEARPRRVVETTSDFKQPVNGLARLNIQRIASLGYSIIVTIRIDGMIGESIPYGQSYEAVLPPGRHVISLLPTPAPAWSDPSRTTLVLQGGRTYYFVVTSDHSGHLILSDVK